MANCYKSLVMQEKVGFKSIFPEKMKIDMKLKRYCLIGLTALLAQFSIAQEGLPIYSDYLTDNYYLIHPSMAGVANCSKVRLTARQQWFGQNDAPNLQTLSINGRIGESQSGVGGIIYNDTGANDELGFVYKQIPEPDEIIKVGQLVDLWIVPTDSLLQQKLEYLRDSVSTKDQNEL